jgi:hypothetical protein
VSPKLLAGLALVAALSAASPASAAEPEPGDVVPPSPSLLFHPAGPGPRRLAVGLGLMLDVPAYFAQGFLPVLPQIEARLRYGLPEGFSLVADLQTIFILSDASVGVAWSTSLPGIPSLSVMIKLAAGASFGGLYGFGYDTFEVAPLVEPGLSLGGPGPGGLRWTVREQVLMNRWQYVSDGGHWARNLQPDFFTGSATLITLENLRAHGGNVYFGGGVMVTRASYALWIPFSQQTALILYPRLHAGYVF